MRQQASRNCARPSPEEGGGCPSPARRFGAALVLAALVASAAPAQEFLRAEFRAELEGEPGASGAGFLDSTAAEARLRGLAAWTYAAMIAGFDFEWTPSDATRGIQESFRLRPRGAVPAESPRLVTTSLRREGRTAFAWIEYLLLPEEARDMAFRATKPWRPAQGRGFAPRGGEGSGPREAVEDALREALGRLLRGLEPNKPRAVLGRAALTEPPRLVAEDGGFRAEARFRVEIVEVLPYVGY